ncbi:MAG TPA: cyclic nucleotide-binding domain-containing protein [Terriglobia bacterium]|jgi:CRP/FNR family cyclic AMP-dependent transcriptional regulator|nr:cyclic nucleotide-binding domain-containing protein [Terriglobia bacterium]
MEIETLKTLLKEHSFVRGLDDRYVDLMVSCATNVRFQPGEYIFREGGSADQFYLLRHGRATVEIYAAERGSITVMTVGEGEVLGWSWLFPPYRWMFDARALELTRAIALDGKCLRQKCDEDHELGYELMKRIVQVAEQRLQAARLQLLNLYEVQPNSAGVR